MGSNNVLYAVLISGARNKYKEKGRGFCPVL